MQTATSKPAFTPPTVTKDDIGSFDTPTLWAILRTTNPMSEMFCNQLCWTKAELRRRGHAAA